MTMAQVFAEDVSVLVVDMDYSNARMTNTLFHSYDAAITISPPMGASGHEDGRMGGERTSNANAGGGVVSIACKTRRMEVLRLPLTSITDIRRRSGDNTETGLPCVEVDFAASSSIFHGAFTDTTSLQHRVTRALRLVCQTHRDQRQNDVLFTSMLTAWRLSEGCGQAASPSSSQQSSPRRLHTTATRSGQMMAKSDRSTISTTSPFVSSMTTRSGQRWNRVAREVDYTVLNDDSDHAYQSFPKNDVERRMVGSSGAPPAEAGSYRAPNVVDFHNISDAATNRMLDTCAELEAQLKLIQQRRFQRQQLLVGLDCRTDSPADYFDTGAPATSLKYFSRDTTGSMNNNAGVEQYDPRIVAQGFASVCPYCGIYGGKEHVETCPQRTVQCLRCLSLMKMREFPMHASLCVRQDAASNPGHMPMSPNAYLNGTSVPPAVEQVTQPPVVLQQPSSTAVAAPPQQPAAKQPPDAHRASSRLLNSPLERSISFADIPRVQSIIVKDKQTLKKEKPVEQPKVLRFVEDERSPPQRSISRSGTATPRRRQTTFADDEPTPSTVECQWCRKYAPPDHPRKCAERRVMCTLCGEEVFLRDKKEHRSVCVGGSPVSSQPSQQSLRRATSTRASAGDLRDLAEQEHNDAIERKMRKLDSYRQRLDVLRKANEENGTPSQRNTR